MGERDEASRTAPQDLLIEAAGTMVTCRLIAILLTTGFVCAAPHAPAKQIAASGAPSAERERLQRYLSPGDITFVAILAAPPSAGTPLDRADRQVVMALQSASDARFRSAELDGSAILPRFDGAFGRPLTTAIAPSLISLLNRALRDVSFETFRAKDHFQRPRPYQRFQLQRICGDQPAPAPEAHPVGGSSYPSGHAAFGWATAMILARVRPERSQILMTRAAEFAESRLVCGVHFPTDIAAGQVIAAAVVARLDANPQFQADLRRARTEFALSAPQP